MIQQHISLQPYNTFGINVYARYFAEFATTDALQEYLLYAKINQLPIIILGGGSNILFTKNVDGIVLKNNIQGITILNETDAKVTVQVGAGVNWHSFVLHCIDKEWYGVENLSLIPGNVGAAPMQNIGAYGVEAKEIIDSVTCLSINDGTVKQFTAAECKFGYRESIFKNEVKGQYVITAVTFNLQKTPHFNTTYGAIQEELVKMGNQTITLKAVSDAVINIRSSKLPNPKDIGNAGSFFKNPSINFVQLQQLEAKYPTIVNYPNTDGSVKLAAGWLIEQCGLKGVRVGNTGCHAKQALVLVNYGNATGEEIVNYSAVVIAAVKEKFGITLEREVNIV